MEYHNFNMLIIKQIKNIFEIVCRIKIRLYICIIKQLKKSKMNTIQRIIEIPLFELQTEIARNMDISISSCCCICGNKIKEGAKSKMVQLLTNGNIISTDKDIENSQGFFTVGSECLKKLVIQFSF